MKTWIVFIQLWLWLQAFVNQHLYEELRYKPLSEVGGNVETLKLKIKCRNWCTVGFRLCFYAVTFSKSIILNMHPIHYKT